MRPLLFVPALLVLLACEGGERREAERLADAIVRFRHASNAEEPATAADLRKVSCTTEDVCRTRDTCLVAADGIAKALRLKNEVEKGIADLDAGKLSLDDAQSLPQKLDEADRVLKDGYTALPACDTQLAALKKRYRF